ncbi:hypothetical protein, partial [Morganella morganii]|uniref:hypothetical protein n=1 Tax=Morganella morganii TaxID=582 RepID=UPI003EB6FA40
WRRLFILILVLRIEVSDGNGDNQSSVLLPLTHVILSNVSMRIQPCKPRTGSPVLKNRLLSGAYFVSLAE